MNSKRWTIIEMRTPSRTDSARSTRGVSGRESSKSMYISELVDYSTRLRAAPFTGDEHIDDAEGQRDCTHGAKSGAPKLLRELSPATETPQPIPADRYRRSDASR